MAVVWACGHQQTFPERESGSFRILFGSVSDPKKLGKAAKEPHLVGYTRFSLMGFSCSFPHTGGQEGEPQDGGVWQGERKGEAGCFLV